MADFSRNLKQHRQERCMSQAQLAEKMNVTRQTVSSWERGNSYPDIGMLTRLAEVLGVEVQELLCPTGRKRLGKGELKPLTPKFWVLSFLSYFLLFCLGGNSVGLPLMRKLFCFGTTDQPYFYILYWGILLAVAFLALCTCIITEYISRAIEILSVSEETANERMS